MRVSSLGSRLAEREYHFILSGPSKFLILFAYVLLHKAFLRSTETFGWVFL